MLVHAERLPAGEELDADVCIAGAGPAGMVLARELGRAGVRVLLVPGGGAAADPRAEELARMPEPEGDLRPPFLRRRQFGGNALLWNTLYRGTSRGVRYVPFDPIDFQRREWVPHSGWPFGIEELEPYYPRALALSGVGPYDFRATSWAVPGASPWPLEGWGVTTSMAQFGTASAYAIGLRRELARSPHVTVLLDASVGELHASPGGGAVSSAQIETLRGNVHRALARVYILAAGAIENARLLLVSNDGTGIGNGRDLVGRFYMDHQWVAGGELIPVRRALFDHAAMYDIHRVRGRYVLGKLAPTPETMRREGLLNSATGLIPKPPARQRRALEAVRGLEDASTEARRGREMVGLLPALPPLALSAAELAVRQRRLVPSIAAGWSSLAMKRRRFATFELFVQLELVPDPENRVVLSDEHDRFGRPLARVRWRWNALERKAWRGTVEVLDRALQRAGLGRVEPPDFEAGAMRPGGTQHPAGTTRMHVDPEQGVVDADQRVHGVANLYVAGSSVFPTNGQANSLLTIVATSLRLADHLVRRANA